MKHANAGGWAPPFSMVVAAALLALGLSACGGGGGGDGGGSTAPAAEAAPPASAPASIAETPATTPVTAPTTAPVTDPYAPVAGSEPAPSASAPQPGSTADVGNGSEGVYESMFGYTYVSGAGDIARQMVVGTIWGSVSITGTNWLFNPETRQYFIGASPVTGSGTFSSRLSMDGSYAVSGGSTTPWGPLAYSSANALAVAQGSVAGTWANTDTGGIGMSITVDAAGVFTGRTSGSRIGVCTVTGSVLLSQPGTAKNLYTLTLQAVNAAATGEPACALDSVPYAGSSAIVFSPAGNFASNGYFRSLSLLIRSANGATLSLGMRRQ
jgi:hypothetical protein